MTFNEIKSLIASLANLEREDSLERVGILINLKYRELTADGYVSAGRRTTVTGTADISSQYLTFDGIEKLERVDEPKCDCE